jgi:hypothetical protein
MNSISSNQPLTPEQVAQDETGLFADLTAAALFSKNANAILAARVMRHAPKLYRALKQEYRCDIGEVRPSEGYLSAKYERGGK